MDYLPIFMDIKTKPCLVVGGGDVASRKINLLINAGAKIGVVSPDLNKAMTQLKSENKFSHLAEYFNETHLDDQILVIAATNDATANQLISETAMRRNIPVNVVDNPKLCSFIMPSIVDRSPVIAAVSTGGKSPVLSRLIRGQLESLIPATYGRLAILADKFRSQVKEKVVSAKRRMFWEEVLQGPISEQIFAGNEADAEIALEKKLANYEQNQPADVGEIYLVGGGPGNPDLLTFRALRLMQQADVILYDRLVTPAVLERTRRDAERIYVGKQRDFHALRQDEINQLMVNLAKQGKRVLRLKGGDPFIFGRGGEEIDTLAAHGIPFQVVPGITAASGCASYAGIPLTHRDYAQSCTFVTGNLQDGSINLNWSMLAHTNQTIVFYMGLLAIDVIFQNLIKHGLSKSTPAAIIQQGTTAHQRVFTGSLESLPDIVKKEKPIPPTLIIVGEVVKLQQKLAWYHP